MTNSSYDGVIPINKPKGMTSHNVVAKLRRILGIKRIGHTGTLDPDVSGVLPICIGKATRLSEYIMELPKTYMGQVTIGVSTTTQDSSGEIIDQVEVKEITEDMIRKVVSSFIGEIEQIPPMYSAVKMNGKKLYEIARQGKEVERKPRTVTIHHIEIISFDLDRDIPTIDFIVSCSKGTYVRTLCTDIGSKLEYPAHMSSLVRVKSGNFSIDEAYTLEEVEQEVESNNFRNIIVPMRAALPQFEELVITDDQIIDNIFNGQLIHLDTLNKYIGIIKIVDDSGNLIALYHKREENDTAKPIKVFK